MLSLQLNDEFLERDKQREEEVTKFKLALEEAAEQQQRTFEIEMTKTRQELENVMAARNAKFKEALLEKDRIREDECAALKLDLEVKYPVIFVKHVLFLTCKCMTNAWHYWKRRSDNWKMKRLLHFICVSLLTNIQARYDSQLRDRYMQERENDIKAVVDARKELEDHHKNLHEKTLVVLQKFKDELDSDLTARYTKGEQELLDIADEGNFPNHFNATYTTI